MEAGELTSGVIDKKPPVEAKSKKRNRSCVVLS